MQAEPDETRSRDSDHYTANESHVHLAFGYFTGQAGADMVQHDILIVEEDAAVREVLHRVFLGAGYNCLLASNAGEGLEAFRKGRPSLVIADLGMPMMMGGQSVSDAGIRLLQQVRQEDPDTAVIVASGMASVGIAIATLKLGAYAFLMKPLNVDELLITAQRAIERRELMIERRQYPSADMVQREVLIVDDDPQVREVVRMIFLDAGYQCLAAKDGREGLEAFHASRPPLIVTDLTMPLMSGIELLQQIRQEDPGLAVIVLASASDMKPAIASLKLGAHAFLMKPVNADELLITAERAIERRQLLIERRHRTVP